MKFSLNLIVIGIGVAVLSSCGESTIDVDGIKVTRAQCRSDFDKLETSVTRLLELGKLATDLQYPSLKILNAISAEQSPALPTKPIPSVDMGDCGRKAQKAFDDFVVEFAGGIGLENGDLYKSLSPSDQERAKRLTLDRVTKARILLSEEREALKKRANGT